MSSDIVHLSSFEPQKLDADLELPNFGCLSNGQAGGLVNPAREESIHVNTIVKDYLRAVDPIFQALDDLRQKASIPSLFILILTSAYRDGLMLRATNILGSCVKEQTIQISMEERLFFTPRIRQLGRNYMLNQVHLRS